MSGFAVCLAKFQVDFVGLYVEVVMQRVLEQLYLVAFVEDRLMAWMEQIPERLRVKMQALRVPQQILEQPEQEQ